MPHFLLQWLAGVKFLKGCDELVDYTLYTGIKKLEELEIEATDIAETSNNRTKVCSLSHVM